MLTNILRISVKACSNRASALTETLRQAAEIRQSLELSEAAAFVSKSGEAANDCLSELTDDLCALGLACIQNEISATNAALDALVLPTVRGLAHDAKSVTHYCVTADKKNGHGVFSAHDNKADALFNAILTGGKCTPVDRNEDGMIVQPAALREARRIASEYC